MPQKLNVHPAQLIDGAYIDMLYTIDRNGG